MSDGGGLETIISDALTDVAQFGVVSPEHAALLDVGTGAFLDYFDDEIIFGLVSRGGATVRIFQGSYGSGKTHLLGLLQERALSRGMAVVHTDLSRSLSLDDWKTVTAYVLQTIEVRFDGLTVRSAPEVLSHLGQSGVVDEARLRSAKLPHPGFKRAMLQALGEEGLTEASWELLRRYLIGERIGAGQLQRVGISGVKDPLSQRNAEQVLNTFLSGLYAAGLPGTVLLFDENERTLLSRGKTPSQKVQRAANLIRRFIDACATSGLRGTLAVFAALPGFVEESAKVYPALGQRLQVVGRDATAPSWRWPVLPVDAIGTTEGPEDFLAQAIARMEELVEECAGDIQGLRTSMQELGEDVLERNAGPGYRRELMKLLAQLAHERIEGG